jgi:dTDP-glucose pyrophosphorylase
MKTHLIQENATIKDAMLLLNGMGLEAINIFVVNEQQQILGSVTDGDIRRAILADTPTSAPISKAMNTNFKYLVAGKYTNADLAAIRKKNIRLVPVTDEQKTFIELIDLNNMLGYLPVDVVMMAGGKGVRLRPLTEDKPKPMLPVGDKPIIEHNIDRLIKNGVKNIYLSVNYLGNIIKNHFKDGKSKNININYIEETEQLGTVGSVKLHTNYEHDVLLVMNSDLLTTIDFADFYESFIQSGADMAVASTSYTVNVPYAILELGDGNKVTSLKEKPQYSYSSNAGIYLLKKELLALIPEGRYDITELMDEILKQNRLLVTYPITGYWLDIGQLEDYKKAQEDIKHLQL